ncbi:ATP-binding cassette domain-containing protein [Mucisphaera sp.]|uniref:ATP-binding cassette domain-containing protein n=1 Tax=Mucisphaera sp. TaxID=2913024 RepID=UPI003D0FFDD2
MTASVTAPIMVRNRVDRERQPASVGGVVLRCSGVRRVFEGGVIALADVDLAVHAGEHVAVVGPSGSGKSTLLGCLGGDVATDAGRVQREGRVARVYQDYRLVERATALANVLHGAAATCGGWARVWQRRSLVGRATLWLRRVGLEQRAGVRVDRLSGGEQQRVAIARALMAEPKIVLADEPVSALDSGSAEAVMQLLREVCREEQIALVSVQHDRELATAYADRVVALRRGELCSGDAIEAEACVEDDPTRLPVMRSAEDRQDCGTCPEGMGRGLAVASAMEEPAAWRRVAMWTAIAGGGLLVLGWAGWMTDLQQVDAGRSVTNLLAFIERAVPTAGELAAISWGRLGQALLETLAMAILGTVAAVTWSLPLASLAARGVTTGWIRTPVRLMLNVIRSVPSILWALLCVAAFGLGALPGIIAVAAYSTGYLTKFFYEAFESADDRVSTALRSLGMSGWEAFWSSTWPASRLAIASSCVFMLEYNFRAASVLGVVGAGGVGYDLRLAVEWGNWHVVLVIIVALAISVCLFDAAADWLRRKLA